MTPKIVIVDYGMGNLHSVQKMLSRIGYQSLISASPADIANCDKLIIPGVGHFGKAMSNLKNLNLLEPLNKAALADKKSVLGICLGMQLMAKKSEEGNSEGLGWFDAEVVKFRVADKLKHKVPHIGWNRGLVKKLDSLWRGISASANFYFLHSYHLTLENENYLTAETVYETVFPSAVGRENIFGVQFHPEKSYEAGAQLLKNFIEL